MALVELAEATGGAARFGAGEEDRWGVTGERRIRILALLASDGPGDVTTKRLCEMCREATGMSGAGIMLMSGVIAWGSLCTTDPVSALIEELQYALGEGPCVDACRHDRAVLEPDLANPVAPRWPAFAGRVIDAGVRGIFGFPLRIGAVRLGALNLYSVHPGPLTDDQHADALVAADVVAQAILVLQANAPPGTLAAELETGADFQYVVHQAAGMVAMQLGVSVGHAIIRIKAHAFGNERSLTEVARDIVGKRLRFDLASGGTSSL